MGRRLRGGTTSLTSFPELSYAAWIAARATEVPHTMAGMTHWAARLAESVDQDDVENDYKRTAAALARQARDEARAGNPDWPATFKRALSATNTIHFMYADNVNKAIAADPERDARRPRARVVQPATGQPGRPSRGAAGSGRQEHDRQRHCAGRSAAER